METMMNKATQSRDLSKWQIWLVCREPLTLCLTFLPRVKIPEGLVHNELEAS